MENIKKLMDKLLDLNMTMIKDGDIVCEYAAYIIEIKNDYERSQEELLYLDRMED